MSKELKNIEELFKGGLGNLEHNGADNWDNILKATNKKLFLRFIPQRFNIYYLGVLLVAVGALTFVFTREGQATHESVLELPSKAQPTVSIDTFLNKSAVIFADTAYGIKSNVTEDKVAVKSVYPKKKRVEEVSSDQSDDFTVVDAEEHIKMVVKDSLLRKTETELASKIQIQSQPQVNIENVTHVKVENEIKKDTVIIETNELKVIEEKVKRKR